MSFKCKGITDLELEFTKELDEFINAESKHNEEFQIALTKYDTFQAENDPTVEDADSLAIRLEKLMTQCRINEIRIKELEVSENLFKIENQKLLKEIEIVNENASSNSQGYVLSVRSLETLLVESKGQLARALQNQDDQILAREVAERELVHEKLLRIQAEKERDAYAAAYEASLKHFEQWSQRRQVLPRASPRGSSLDSATGGSHSKQTILSNTNR